MKKYKLTFTLKTYPEFAQHIRYSNAFESVLEDQLKTIINAWSTELKLTNMTLTEIEDDQD